MFKNLPASQGAKRGIFTGKTAITSLIFHGLLLAGAVYATVRAPEAKKKEEEQVEFVDVKEKQPEPEKPKEEPKPQEAPPPPKGTQTIEPPSEPPPAIPAVDLSAPPVSAEDFSGVGKLGGTAKGVEEAPKAEDQPGFAYEVAVLEKKPELSNKGQIASLMERLYPRLLQDAGIGGTVTLQFVIDADGTVDMSTVKVLDSPNDQLSDASIKAVEKFKFKPGKYKGENVRVLIQMPITWQPAG